MRVTSLDMRQASSKCPSSLCENTTPLHFAEDAVAHQSLLCLCKLTYIVVGVSYSHVCGKITAYQFGTPNAYSTRYSNIFDGISITYRSPEMTFWIFLAANSMQCTGADTSYMFIYRPKGCKYLSPPLHS